MYRNTQKSVDIVFLLLVVFTTVRQCLEGWKECYCMRSVDAPVGKHLGNKDVRRKRQDVQQGAQRIRTRMIPTRAIHLIAMTIMIIITIVPDDE